MKKTKKALASLTIAGMILTMVPFNAFATGTVPTRLFGTTAAQTAVAIADQTGWTGTAILASSASYGMVDALTSGPLAKFLNAPILLQEPGAVLNAYTKAELLKLNVTKVYVTSGTAVINQAVLNELATMNITVESLGGADRFETSVNIAKKMVALGAPVTKVAVAYGWLNQDALSIASIASAANEPILLTEKNAVPASVKAFLTANITSSDVIGGTGVISDAVEAQFPSATRYFGNTAYDTNVAVLKGFDSVLKYDHVFIANGETAVDALTGAPLAAKYNSGIVLTNGTVNEGTTYVSSKLSATSIVSALGGTAVVSEGVLASTSTPSITPPVTPPVTPPSNNGDGGAYAAAQRVQVATDAVAKAELSKLQADVVSAKVLVDALPNDVAGVTKKVDLLARLATVTAPVISNVSFVSNNPNNTKAMNGDTITLTFTSDKPVNKLSSFKINGSNPDTFTVSGNTYTATHLVDSGDKVGDAVFQINVQTNVLNPAYSVDPTVPQWLEGIYSQTIETTTDSSKVGIIAQYARITNVNISSSNANNTKAMNGDTITLTFTSDESVTKLSNFKINGSNPNTFTNVDNVYTATHLVDVGDIITGIPATFQINVKNAAGIDSLTVEGTTDGSSVTINPSVTLGVATATAGKFANEANINEMMTALFATGDSTVQGIAIKPVFSVAGTTLTIKGNNVSPGLLQWIDTQWGGSSIPVAISFNNGTPPISMTTDLNWNNGYTVWVDLNTLVTGTVPVEVTMTNGKKATYSIVVSPTAAELAALTTTPSAIMTAGISVGGYTPYTGVDFSTTNATEIYGIQLDGIVIKLPQDSDSTLYFNDLRPAGTYYFYLHLRTSGLWEKVTIVK
jgi:putative cell wall-binding protein